MSPSPLLIPRDSADYPALLRRLPDAPAQLWVLGDPALLWHAQVAVVGSRNPSTGGRENARDFARTLARAGLVVTSGLADGIDAEAHRAALEAGHPTIAVLGCGIDVVYPKKNARLYADIAARGAIASEYAPGTAAHKALFPRRNRIISGLSLGTLVIEASLQSGSLITARLAAEQGREVFALPGSIHNPMSRGCHRLIRDGATLVESAPEIIDALSAPARELGALLRERIDEPSPPTDEPGDPDYARLWDALEHDPLPLDVLVQRSGLTVGALSSMLLLMELEGRVSAAQGRYAKRRS